MKGFFDFLLRSLKKTLPSTEWDKLPDTEKKAFLELVYQACNVAFAENADELKGSKEIAMSQYDLAYKTLSVNIELALKEVAELTAPEWRKAMGKVFDEYRKDLLTNDIKKIVLDVIQNHKLEEDRSETETLSEQIQRLEARLTAIVVENKLADPGGGRRGDGGGATGPTPQKNRLV
jgi:hypothetical protein